MRVLLFIALLTGLCLPVLLADIQPSATTIMGTGAGLVEASMATATTVAASPENFALRVFSMLVGVLLLLVATYLAFGPRPKQMAVKVLSKKAE
jgi:hypothetical protein